MRRDRYFSDVDDCVGVVSDVGKDVGVVGDDGTLQRHQVAPSDVGGTVHLQVAVPVDENGAVEVSFEDAGSLVVQ